MSFICNKYIRISTALIVVILIIGIPGYVIYGGFSNQNDKDTNANGWLYKDEYRVDKEPLTKRFPSLGNFDKCFWKAGIIGESSSNSIPAPTSYWIKGFVILNIDQLDKFYYHYDWKEMKKGWRPSLDTRILEKQELAVPLKWSYNEDFTKDFKPAGYSGNFYLDFDNGIIFFDVQK